MYIYIYVYIYICIYNNIYIHIYICIYNYKSNSQRETVQVWFGHLPLQAHRPHDRQPFLRQVTSADLTGTSSPEKPIFCWEKPGFFFVGNRIFLLGKTRDSPFFCWETHFFLLEKPKNFPNKTSESRLIYPKPRSWAVLRNLAELLTHPRFGRITFPA